LSTHDVDVLQLYSESESQKEELYNQL